MFFIKIYLDTKPSDLDHSYRTQPEEELASSCHSMKGLFCTYMPGILAPLLFFFYITHCAPRVTNFPLPGLFPSLKSHPPLLK